MNVTDETGLDKQYRLVLDTDTSTVTGRPTTDRRQVMAEFDEVVAAFAAVIASGELRVRVLSEDVWAQRGGR